MEIYKDSPTASYTHILDKEETSHLPEVWKELLTSISSSFRNLPSNIPENEIIRKQKIGDVVNLMVKYLSWMDGEKPDPEILANSPFFAVCRDAFASLMDSDLSVKSLECIYKSIKVFPILLPHLIEANLFQAFSVVLPFRDMIPFPKNKFITEKSLHLIAEGCRSSYEFTEIAISIGLLDIVFDILNNEIDSFDPKTPYTLTLIGIVKNGFKFFVNLLCRPDIGESINPGDIITLMVECLRNGTHFDECATSYLYKLFTCCERSREFYLSLDVFPVLWERVSTSSYKTEKSYVNTFKLLNYALDIEEFPKVIVPMISCACVVEILGNRVGISSPKEGTCIAHAFHLVTKMVMRNFIEITKPQENLSEIFDLCAAVCENQQFVDKDAAARFYFTMTTKIGAPTFEGTEAIAGLLIESIDTKSDESMEAAILGLETITESFRKNDVFSENAKSFLEECADTEPYGERAQYLLDTYFNDEQIYV